MNELIVAYIWTSDGVKRPVYQQMDGRQYWLDDDGEPVYGVWFIPPDEADVPVVVGAH